MSDPAKLVTLTQKLLDSIAACDFSTYALLCSEDMTCFEPEAKGTLVEGQEFHKWYFDQHKAENKAPPQQNMCQPKVRMLGSEAAVVSYIRLMQVQTESGMETRKFEETRVWQIINGAWTSVHFHRSAVDR